jgi:nitroreductase
MMAATTVDPRTVRSALQLAARAPSVHNTQPWKWRIGDGFVELLADEARRLRATDQDGRDLMLSCGAALHHLRVALAAAGVDTTVHRLPDPGRPELLATIDLHPGSGRNSYNSGVDPEQAAAIPVRRTDRRRFDGWAVPDRVIAQFVQQAGAQGAILRVVSDGMALHTLYAAIRAAAAEHDEDAVVEAELIAWTGLHGGDAGVPAVNIPVPGKRSAGPPERRFAAAELVERGAVTPDSATLLVIGTSSDDRLSQLRAGEAASAVLLQAALAGMSSSPLTEPLEVARTRMVVADEVLDGTLSPQMVIRVGWPSGAGTLPPLTPRRALDEQIER